MYNISNRLMHKIKNNIDITDTIANQIRRQIDPQNGVLHFSITDILGVLTTSVDARNYWKSLKNRLKSKHPQLVTNFNQLKMQSSDGKFYMVDTANADTLLKIIDIVSPQNTHAFSTWFNHLEAKNDKEDFWLDKKTTSLNDTTHTLLIDSTKKLSTYIEPAIDMYEDFENIFIETMIPAIDPKEIVIVVNFDTLKIKSECKNILNINTDNYILQELCWKDFYKEIKLPVPINTNEIEATAYQGLIKIKLKKIDRVKNRFIKIISI